jgi:tetratricopeptide (TPR) repeat protein
MREMLQAVVPDLPADALAHIVSRADGIPLYAVETVRMLLADGRLAEADGGGYRLTRELGGFDVPESLRSLITSRLDALDPADHDVIEAASVLGQTFGVDALAALTAEPSGELETRLRQLVRRELMTLELDPRSPERGQFGFTQSLVREVAYSTLSRPQRRERHLAAARFIEANSGDELAGALAGHYVAAFEASAAGAEADAVATQARIALRAAAERAAALGGHKQAGEFLRQALTVTTVPADRAQLLEERGRHLSLAGEHDAAIESTREAIDSYRSLGDMAGVARSRTLLGFVLISGNRERPALEELEAGLAELPADIEPALRADMLAKLARAAYRNEDWQRAVTIASEALAIAEQHRLMTVAADALISKGSALDIGLRLIEGLTLLRGGYELARRVGDTASELRAAANLALGLSTEETNGAAMEITLQALETARRVGDMPQVAWHTNNAVFGAIFMGQPLSDQIVRIEDLFSMGLSANDRMVLLRALAFTNGLLGNDVEPIIGEYEQIGGDARGGLTLGLDLYRTYFVFGQGRFADAARLAERTHDERNELGMLPWATLSAVMSDDPAEARRLLGRAETAAINGRIGEAELVISRVAVAAMDAHPAESTLQLRAAMDVLADSQNFLEWSFCALILLHALGGAEPGVRAWAERGLVILEDMGATPLAKLVQAELAAQSDGPLTNRSSVSSKEPASPVSA